MANTILHKRSSSSGTEPVVGDLSLGELGINTNDGKVFLKKDNGSDEIVELVPSIYGVGEPPDATNIPDGTIYYKYEV